MRKLSKKSWILLVIGVCLLAFIWGHSMQNKAASAEESGRMLRILTPFLEIVVGKGNVTDHLVRKLAHFAEFSALGLDLLWLWKSLGMKRYFLLALNTGWLAAFLDESIQMFSDRGDQIIDVWLDFAGCVFGALVALLVSRVVNNKKRKV